MMLLFYQAQACLDSILLPPPIDYWSHERRVTQIMPVMITSQSKRQPVRQTVSRYNLSGPPKTTTKFEALVLFCPWWYDVQMSWSWRISAFHYLIEVYHIWIFGFDAEQMKATLISFVWYHSDNKSQFTLFIIINCWYSLVLFNEIV